MLERNRTGVQREARLLAIPNAIFVIADNRMANAGKMDANLVLAARQQIEFQQCEVFSLFQYRVGRTRQFSFCLIGGRVYDVCLVFRQVSRDRSGCLTTLAMNDREVFLLRVFPLILQAKLRLDVLREDEYPRCLPIQAVYDENPIA